MPPRSGLERSDFVHWHEREVPMRTTNIGLFRIIEVRLNAAADGL